MKKLFLLLALLFACRRASANTIQALSCSQTDVQNAVNSAVSGDTVLIKGTCTTNWTSFVTIQASQNITVQANGSVTIGTTSKGFLFTSGTGTTRLTGFTCNNPGSVPSNYNGNCIQVVATGTGTYRVDHWNMCSGGGSCTTPNTIFVSINGPGPGLWDHDTILHNGSAAFQISAVSIGCDYTTGVNNCNWGTTVVPGGPNMTFFEDDTMTNTGCQTTGCNEGSNGWEQAYGGAVIVVRHSTINTSAGDAHGSQGGGNEPAGPQCPGGGPFCEGSVGTRWMENYNNNYVLPSGGAEWYAYFDIRAGSGVFFNNTISGGNNGSFGYLKLREENTCSWPNGFQVGAGINGFTTNPSCSNHYTTCGGGTLNTAPYYLWQGTGTAINTGASSPTQFNLNLNGTVQLNRDVFVSTSQPSSMHWMEASGDTCSTTYSYAPYTYPHPLVSGGGSPTQPNPPTGLTATVN